MWLCSGSSLSSAAGASFDFEVCFFDFCALSGTAYSAKGENVSVGPALFSSETVLLFFMSSLDLPEALALWPIPSSVMIS